MMEFSVTNMNYNYYNDRWMVILLALIEWCKTLINRQRLAFSFDVNINTKYCCSSISSLYTRNLSLFLHLPNVGARRDCDIRYGRR